LPQVDFDLYLITDRHQCRGRDVVSCVEQALRGGVRAVQLRDKDMPTDQRYELGLALQRLTSEFDAKLLVNGDAALALAIGADGVHLPQDGLAADVCRSVAGPDALIGVSTHSIEEAREAAAAGADFITCGPAYFTPSKAKYGPPIGLDGFRAVCASVDVPVFALGGVNASNVNEVLAAGAAGVAMISGILGAADIESTAAEIIRCLRRAGSAQAFPEKDG
jgi:thiamine-phosphate pyrophosphorylase